MIRIWKILAVMVICVMAMSTKTIFAAGGVAAKKKTSAEQPEIDGRAGIVMDAKTGKILFQKNINEKHYPASITKILTTLVAIENNDDLYGEVTFSGEAVNTLEEGSTHIGIQEGETLPLIDVLYAIMLESANEACNGAAEYTAGSNKKFVKLMNEKAKELGCDHSHFVTTNGLHDDDHYVTAKDMATITKAALENETFRKIACSSNYYITPTNKSKEARQLWNHHKMVKKTMFPYEGIEGGKTGYTTRAGGTLVTFVKRDNLELICVVLQGNGYELYKDTIKMLDYAYDNYKVVTPFKGIQNVIQDNGLGILKAGNQLPANSLQLGDLDDVSILLEKSQDEEKLSYRSKGKNLYVDYNGKNIGKVQIY